MILLQTSVSEFTDKGGNTGLNPLRETEKRNMSGSTADSLCWRSEAKLCGWVR